MSRLWLSRAAKVSEVSSSICLVMAIESLSCSKSNDETRSGVGSVTTWSFTSPKKFSMDCNCPSTSFTERSMSLNAPFAIVFGRLDRSFSLDQLILHCLTIDRSQVMFTTPVHVKQIDEVFPA